MGSGRRYPLERGRSERELRDLIELRRLLKPPPPYWMTPHGVSEDYMMWLLGQ